jgi:hypothetical protein
MCVGTVSLSTLRTVFEFALSGLHEGILWFQANETIDNTTGDLT